MQTTPPPDSSPLQYRPAFTVAPIAQAERLARYARRTYNADTKGVLAELTAWRYREKGTLSDELLVQIARTVAA